MFIERIANVGFSSVGAASVASRCRSYGASRFLPVNIYKHCAPTELEKLCRYLWLAACRTLSELVNENGRLILLE